MITIKDYSKKYKGKTEVMALEHIDLEIPQGQVIGLFGDNGAGKSTLLKSILGFLKGEGEILLDGEPITHKNITRISFATIEHSFFPGLTLEEHHKFYKEQFAGFREKRYQGLVDFFELPTDRKLSTLSQGQQNQIEVILALSQGADYILMDEPFSGNDMFNREDFYKVMVGLLEPTETILMATHLLNEVSPYLDRAILIRKGKCIGDISISQIEDEGMTMREFVEQAFSYEKARVAKALASMREEEVQ